MTEVSLLFICTWRPNRVVVPSKNVDPLLSSETSVSVSCSSERLSKSVIHAEILKKSVNRRAFKIRQSAKFILKIRNPSSFFLAISADPRTSSPTSYSLSFHLESETENMKFKNKSTAQVVKWQQ